jgi:hypothetical protein
MDNGIFDGEIEAVKSILYYKNYLPISTTHIPGLPILLSPCSMRSIRLVIALLHPRDQRQNLLNGIRPQG